MKRADHLLLGFCTDKTDRISTLIRWATWSPVSHVVLISPCRDQIIEATHGKGVVLGTLTEFLARDGAELRRIPHHDPYGVWARALSQVGKPYDWRYSLSWLLRRDWQDPAAWACAELIAWAAELFADGYANSISPRDLHLISVSLPFLERIAL